MKSQQNIILQGPFKESTYHLLSECDAFAYTRFTTLKHPYPPPPYDYLSAGQLLGFLKEAFIQWLPADPDDSASYYFCPILGVELKISCAYLKCYQKLLDS